MAIIPKTSDYTDLDFDSLNIRLRNLVQSVYPEWTDFTTSIFSNILLELFAYVGDVQTFLMNNQAGEAFITTATLRESLVAHMKKIGYEAGLPQPSTAEVIFTLANALAGDVTLPAGTVVQTSEVTNPILFQLTSALVIQSGTTTNTATVENTTTHAELFESSRVRDQRFLLPATPFTKSGLSVVDSIGPFTEVDNFLDSLSVDRHYVVSANNQNQATITFGDGVSGVVPSGTINISYRTGGGSGGNVDAGTLNRIPATFTDTFGNRADLTVVNPNSAVGGADRESKESIRERGPQSLRVLTRAVAREDFEIVALKDTRVARALMVTSDQDPIIDENTGLLFIVPAGGGLPTASLKNDISAVFNDSDGGFPSTLTFSVVVSDPIYTPIDVDVIAYPKNGYTLSAMKNNIVLTLGNYLALTAADGTKNATVDFGFSLVDSEGDPSGELPWSTFFDLVQGSEGVRKIDDSSGLLLNGLRQDVYIDIKSFPTIGNIRVYNGETGLEIA